MKNKGIYYSNKTRLMIDFQGMNFEDGFFAANQEKVEKALIAMKELEGGAIANPDENRMVGHYWLRNAKLAPTPELRSAISDSLAEIKKFAAAVHSGEIKNKNGKKFRNVMLAGIGGSSLGPVFVSKALKKTADQMQLFFLDNTDPAGMDDVFAEIEGELEETLTIVISKSGGTVETRNCMNEARAFYESHGLSFNEYAICITGNGSKLYRQALEEKWMKIFPMWDWVGGRTSVMSAVGLVPLTLAGLDIDAFLQGAADCDELSRSDDVFSNPGALLALSWYQCSNGEGGESMVILPYRDTLDLFAKYLQQLVMESLGKEFDLAGNKVKQGLAVFGNKGSTDQHSYVQQLVGGPDNIFVTFIQILKDRDNESLIVGEESTSGDYLNAFMLGTKKALEDHGKRTIIITVPEVSPYQIGQLIALYERAVGIYAQLIGINAYHQPAVEHGKKAATGLIALKNELIAFLSENKGEAFTAAQLAEKLSADESDIFRLLLHMNANDPRIEMKEEAQITESKFQLLFV